MMPIKDGFSVAKKIRQKSDLEPILFLTATSQDQDKLDGFRAGGDDYITNPFNRKELVLRMEVFLRRTKKMHSALVLEYTIGNLRFSFTNLKIYVAQQEISLSQREADLLKVFCQHPNKVLKREEVCSMYGLKMLTFHA